MAAKNIDIADRFDPREITLRQFIDLYRQQEGAGKDYGKKFETRKELATLLDRPVIEVLAQDMIQDADSPINLGIKNATSEGMKTEIRGTLRGIERNVFRMMDQYGIPREDYVNVSEQIVIAPGTGTAKYTDRINFNPEALGEWYRKAEEFIEANPKQAPAVYAFMYALQTGFRPEEVLQTDARHIVNPEKAGNPIGVFMTPKNMQKKTGNVMNAPLSNHAQGILAVQSQHNKGLKGNTPFVFMIEDPKTGKARRVTTADVNAAIRQIKVPGILIDISGESPRKLDTFSEMYDARRMNATVYDYIEVSQDRAAMLKGRDVKVQGSGREKTYIGPGPGIYGKGSVRDVNRFANFIQNQYVEAGGELLPGIETDSPLYKMGLNAELDVPPLALSKPLEIVREEGDDAPSTTRDQQAGESEADKVTATSEGTSKALKGLMNRGRVLGPLAAVTGLSFTAGMSEAEAQGAGPAGQVVAGVGYTAYDLFAPVASLAVEPGTLAGPEVADQPADLPELGPQETEFTRQQIVRDMDRKESVIAEQKARIKQYDEYMARKTNPKSPMDSQMNQVFNGEDADITIEYQNEE